MDTGHETLNILIIRSEILETLDEYLVNKFCDGCQHITRHPGPKEDGLQIEPDDFDCPAGECDSPDNENCPKFLQWLSIKEKTTEIAELVREVEKEKTDV